MPPRKRSDCKVRGKQKYSSQAAADNAATALGWTGQAGLRSYECRSCGYWHIGRPMRAKP